MLDPAVMNTTALKACLNPLGHYVETTGLSRPLADYSQDEILALINTVVVAYRDSMLSQYEAAQANERRLYAQPNHAQHEHCPSSRGVHV